ncbi:MAG TPA: NAD(P)-dependent oxidoreductase [Bacteroidales bacterium]|nr:NAD(P)-dependent oxidoreductase [Bacteroidales bacterium]HPS18172.1 NAD(P)-dependent oxidoreductase [Bacteroidales bacterium]
MMNILVTGSEGFIGKLLVAQLMSKGYNVKTFDYKDGDITKADSLNIFDESDIKHIFHLAAKTFVPDSWKNPYDFYNVNVLGTTNVLGFCRKNNCSLTYISSYVYGNPDYLPIDENHKLKSYNPYSNSKILAEGICSCFADNYRIKTCIIRPFNVYGVNQLEVFLIPEIIKKVYNDKIIEVMDLKPKRDFVFVDDVVDALMLSVDKEGIYNVGSGYSVSVEEIIKIVLKVTSIKKEYSSKNISRENEVFDVIANISKAKKELNWQPKTSIEEGIKRCVDNFIINK